MSVEIAVKLNSKKSTNQVTLFQAKLTHFMRQLYLNNYNQPLLVCGK